jgi:hypothetical protein
MVGQRVRVTRASADWDAPVGALGTVTCYDGANDRGTDWAVGFLQDGAEAFAPSWPVDESSLEAAGPGSFEPLPFDAHCIAPSGAWMDEIITCLEVDDPPDRDARVASSVTVLQPLVGGTPLATEFIWHPRPARAGDILTLITTWCACRPWTEIVAPLRRRFSESCWIADQGWEVEFALTRGCASVLFGPDAVGFRLFVEPWSSFERRPRGARYPPSPTPPPGDGLSTHFADTFRARKPHPALRPPPQAAPRSPHPRERRRRPARLQRSSGTRDHCKPATRAARVTGRPARGT